MLKATSNQGAVQLKYTGSIPELIADVLALNHALYIDMLEHDIALGEAYEDAITHFLPESFKLTASDYNELADFWAQEVSDNES